MLPCYRVWALDDTLIYLSLSLSLYIYLVTYRYIEGDQDALSMG